MSVHLTPTEHEALVLLSHGKTPEEVSKIFKCKKHTVDFHIYNIYNKTGIRRLVPLLLELGYIKVVEKNGN